MLKILNSFVTFLSALVNIAAVSFGAYTYYKPDKVVAFIQENAISTVTEIVQNEKFQGEINLMYEEIMMTTIKNVLNSQEIRNEVTLVSKEVIENQEIVQATTNVVKNMLEDRKIRQPVKQAADVVNKSWKNDMTMIVENVRVICEPGKGEENNDIRICKIDISRLPSNPQSPDPRQSGTET